MATREEADNAAEMNAAMDPSDRPSLDRRKSSFSDTLNKFATNTFSRRRTVANVPTGTSAQSRLPTASGIARSTSFFRNLNAFGSKTNTSGSTLVSSSSLASFPRSDRSKIENQQPSSRSGKLSTRIAQTPFFSRQASAPVTPQYNHQPRESSVQIIQHQLMAPLGPPVPRRKTLGELQGELASATSSPRTPSYARTTSSSENRRKAILGAFKENQILTPTHAVKKTPTTTSSSKGRGGTPHPKRTPASISSGISRIPVRAAPKTSKTLTPTLTDVPEPNSSGNARVSFSNADEISLPVTSELLEPQAEPKVEESETPTPTPGSSAGRALANLRQKLEAAKLAVVREKLQPAEAHAEAHLEAQTEDVAEETESRAETPIPQNPRHIHTAMPTGYWAGRFTALSDRFRTEEMQNPTAFPAVSGMHDDGRRTRRVFVHLNSLCQTEEAKASLAAFKLAYTRRVVEEYRMERGGIFSGKGERAMILSDEEDEEEGEEEKEEEVVVVGQQEQVKKKGGLFWKKGKGGKKGRKRSGGW